jgi:hypothetical protein
MANHRTANVLFVDTTGDFPGIFHVKAIKYIGSTSGTALIKKTNTSGKVLWEARGAADLQADHLILRSPAGLRVEVTNGASVYLYLK